MNWTPFYITFKLALITSLVLFIISIPLAYWLAYSKNKFKFIVEALVSMPIVLPPSVLGFYLLIALGNDGFIGGTVKSIFDVNLAFTFTGLIIGSVIYSLPFMVQPIQNGFEALPSSLKEASYTLGKNRWTTLTKVLLPCIKPALLTGTVLSFAHTIGEFGVVLMIGGNLEETRVASIAIYDSVNRMDYDSAYTYSFILLLFSFVILSLVYLVTKKGFNAFGKK